MMKIDMTWLVGSEVTEIEKKDFSWFFVFKDHGTVGTESMWRILTIDGLGLTSEDHEQQFGLPSPVNAAVVALDLLKDSSVKSVEVRRKTSDLVLQFANGCALEFLNTSSGYEGWQATHGKQHIICMGGGELSMYEDN